MSEPLTMKLFGYSIQPWRNPPRIVVDRNREALAAICSGLEEIRNSEELAEALANVDGLTELTASVAVVRKLERELADRDATDADHAVLNSLRESLNPWVRAAAGRLLVQIADGGSMSAEIPAGYRKETAEEVAACKTSHCEACAQPKCAGSKVYAKFSEVELCVISGENDCHQVGFFVRTSDPIQ